jgi:hypothetical protein
MMVNAFTSAPVNHARTGRQRDIETRLLLDGPVPLPGVWRHGFCIGQTMNLNAILIDHLNFSVLGAQRVFVRRV